MSRRRNPFRRNRQTADNGASAPDTTAAPDASVILGDGLAEQLAAAVDSTPGLADLIVSTASGVTPDQVDDPTVTLVGLVLDTSISIRRHLQTIGRAHDELVRALLPALREGVTILVTCSTLDGTVLYPLTRLQDVRLFGQQRSGSSELDYSHMSSLWRLIPNTPLRDRVHEQVAAMMAELLKWEDPRVARTVNVISAVITDGLDNASRTTVPELRDLIGEIEDGGSFTAVATYIGDLDDEFRELLVANIRRRHQLPDDYEQMSTEELLRWWFYEQGFAAMPERLFLPGSDPRAIRRAVGQMSQVAFQASVGAFREEPDVAEA